MARKVPIESVGRFYELKKPDDCCVVCRNHRYVIVQKLTHSYAMHTYLAVPNSPAYCIHTWRTREDDPVCLKAFAPTERLVAVRASFKSLYPALQMQGLGFQRDNMARLRAEAGRLRGEAPAPRNNEVRINARRFRNVIGDNP